jgi:type IV pilus assembly protein PilC
VPRYLYVAKSFQGETKSGILEAPDENQLARVLRQEGYVLISAEAEGVPKEKKFEISLPFSRGVSLSEKMIFTRNLQVMISAGVSLPRALSILSLQSKSKKFKGILKDIENQIMKGKSFSESLAKYPEVFPEIMKSMIKVGEQAGTLEDVLKTLTRQMEREHELRSKITGAMIYPAVIICAMIGIGILMLITVIPKLAETFEELNVDLPATTRFVISLGTFLAQKWYAAIFLIFIFVLIFRFVLKTKSGKKSMDFLTLKIPIVSGIIRKTNAAFTVRTLSSLIISGVPIVQALEIVSGTLGNSYFRNAITDAAEKVRKGAKLSEAMKPYDKLYPILVIQMIEVGEETGETSSILEKLADFFEEEVTNATKNLSSVIEPVLMLVIGGVVGFFAVSMIQPMYSMLGSIQ